MTVQSVLAQVTPDSTSGGGSALREQMRPWMLYASMVPIIGGVALLIVVLWDRWRGRFRDPLRHRDRSSGSREGAADRAGLGQDALAAEAPAAGIRATRVRASESSGTGMLSEAQKLFTLMGEAEELVGKLRLDLEQREQGVRALLVDVDRKLAEAQALHAAMATMSAAQMLPAQMSVAQVMAQEGVHEPRMTPPVMGPVVSPAVVTVPRPFASRAMATAFSARPLDEHDGQRKMVMPAAPVTFDADGPDPLTAEIYRLSDQGLTSMDIARQLSQHMGKVELILALRQ